VVDCVVVVVVAVGAAIVGVVGAAVGVGRTLPLVPEYPVEMANCDHTHGEELPSQSMALQIL